MISSAIARTPGGMVRPTFAEGQVRLAIDTSEGRELSFQIATWRSHRRDQWCSTTGREAQAARGVDTRPTFIPKQAAMNW
jgi:hypothetical protein